MLFNILLIKRKNNEISIMKFNNNFIQHKNYNNNLNIFGRGGGDYL